MPLMLKMNRQFRCKMKRRFYFMANNVCKKCGSVIEGNPKFCSQCGAMISQPQEQSSFCPNCKAAIQPGKSYCSNCGTILYANVSHAPAAQGAKPQDEKKQKTDSIESLTDTDINLHTAKTAAAAAAAGGAPQTQPSRRTQPKPAQPQQSYSQNAAARQNGYKPAYNSFRPTVSDAGDVPSFSIDGKLPTAAYSEEKANAAASDYRYQGGSKSSYSPYRQTPRPAAAKPAEAKPYSASPVSSAAAASVYAKAVSTEQTQKFEINKNNMNNNNQQTAKNLYVDEYDEDYIEDDRSEKGSRYAPVSTWGFIGIMLLSVIPVIGWIFVIVWACGGCRKINKRNYARAALIMTLISIIVTCACGYLLYRFYGETFDSIVNILKLFSTLKIKP